MLLAQFISRRVRSGVRISAIFYLKQLHGELAWKPWQMLSAE